MIYCKDCKFFKHNIFNPKRYSECIHPANTSTYDGSIVPKYADMERSFGDCGMKANRFEPKEN